MLFLTLEGDKGSFLKFGSKKFRYILTFYNFIQMLYYQLSPTQYLLKNVPFAYLNFVFIQTGGMIKKLPEHVINKIAAGQVIQRPFNVIKQLVQNSIDAGSKTIQITINEGGLKLIKISDNGKGIQLEDFPLLCARFATSKITQFSDLRQLTSFGFRGQALASLSYVSSLFISSRNEHQTTGNAAKFKDEKIEEGPRNLNHQIGTTITATNLFENLSTRRQSLNPNEEKKRIIKLLSHFSLHYCNIKFTLYTQKGKQDIPWVKQNNSIENNKMTIFQRITNLPYDKITYLVTKRITTSVEGQGIITKLNASKGKTLLLNINNRIVECQQVYKAVEKAYSECYKSIHSEVECFYVYLNLQIDPKNIDCNVHPTKKSIGFFNGQQLYQSLQEWVTSYIKEESAIKILKPIEKALKIDDFLKNKIMSQQASQLPQTQKPKQIQKNVIYDYNKKRTDNTQLPLQFYMKRNQPRQKAAENLQQFKEDQQKLDKVESQKPNSFKFPFSQMKDLNKENSIRELFLSFVYVGCIGLNYIFVQQNNKLFMVNLLSFIKGYIMNFIKLKPLLVKYIKEEFYNVKEILSIFLDENPQIEIERQKIIKWTEDEENRVWMSSNFGLHLEKQYVRAYPCVDEVFMDYCYLNPSQIAFLICRIYNEAGKSGKYFDIMTDFICAQFENQESKDDKFEQMGPFNEKYSSYLQNLIIPSLKKNAYEDEKVNKEEYIRQMLDLKDIYRIFQRC